MLVISGTIRQRSHDLLSHLWAPFLEYLYSLQEAKQILSKKPDWAVHMPDRSWRRHSALLMQLHERHRDT